MKEVLLDNLLQHQEVCDTSKSLLLLGELPCYMLWIKECFVYDDDSERKILKIQKYVGS